MTGRRTVLKLGMVAGSAVVAPAAITQAARAGSSPATAAPAHPGHAAMGSAAGPPPGQTVVGEPYTSPLVIPPVLRPRSRHGGADHYELTHAVAEADILPGVRTTIQAYGGSYVGPTIRARRGRPVVIRHTNQLTEPTAVHLHGGHVPADSDGHPMDLIAPGSSRVYHYPNEQRAATLWYHDHAHGLEAEHIYRGLHGFYLLEDAAELRLRLPRGRYDVPLMLTDGHFGPDGQLIWTLDDFTNRTTVLVNGRQQPYLRVERRAYRFRVLDAANLRFFSLSLSNGAAMHQIASDGGLLAAPVPVAGIELTPGERADVVIDFSRFPAGTEVLLVDATAGPLLRFDVTGAGHEAARLPTTLAAIPAPPTPTVVRQFTMGLDPATFVFGINGKPFDMDRIDTVVKRGTSEIWEVSNTDPFGIPHNFHLHLVQFRILSRNGQPPPPQEAGFKDTVRINVGDMVRLQATFGDHTGRYVYHCHIPDHSSAGMMAQMEIVD